MDLSSHGVTDDIPTTLEENFYMQISAMIEKSILFNIVESMHDTVTKMVSISMFSRSIIRINTTRIY